jgi:hypothetical protein
LNIFSAEHQIGFLAGVVVSGGAGQVNEDRKPKRSDNL